MTKRNLNNTSELLAEFFQRVGKYSAGTLIIVSVLAFGAFATFFLGEVLLEAISENPILLLPFGLIIIIIVAAIHTYKEYKKQVAPSKSNKQNGKK